MDETPEPLRALEALLEGDETLEQAATLSAVLRALPELQQRLRERRQHVVYTLHERDRISYTDMAPRLGVKPERVSGIARGHSRSPRKKAGE
ncbi:sigma-70 family RNA polymerase sigma factor [Streptomyces sp. NPDC059786]|uniref:sigma-70 family RNA polymerase sigma factor n=1 Tax=Streptomyces sp. NPDC059786 TaxID=3346946 RepID=UPI003657A46E